MSDLLIKIFSGQTPVEEVVEWLSASDVTVQKEGCTKISFARYLLNFLHKQTQALLPTQDLPISVPDPVNPQSKSFETSTPLKTASHESTPPNYKSILLTPNTRLSSDSKCTTPISRNASGNRTRTPFSSSCNSSSLSYNVSSSSPSMELLERRLTSRENSRHSPQPLQMKDFMVIKEKPKKKRKRIKPTPCNLDESLENSNNTSQSKLPDQFSPMKIDRVSAEKQIIPNFRNHSDGFQEKQNEQVKILKRVSLVKISDQSIQTSPAEKRNNSFTSNLSIENVEMMSTSVNEAPVNAAFIKEESRILLKKLALLYSTIITSNYVPDLLKELNYIMSILTSNVESDSFNRTSKENIIIENGKVVHLFEMKEEGIFFAALVHELQWELLKQLNVATLSSLAKNERLKVFVPNFIERVCNYIEERNSSVQNIGIMDREMLSETVKFKMDTDCRPNYLNDQLFYAFKKQRDEFYSLLQDWKEEVGSQRNSADFFKAKQKKMRLILTASTASTNMYRLADLFVSQILASVFNENNESEMKPNVDGIPSSKFDLLNRRFIAPSSLVTNNEKRFPGVQEFFKDFIRISSAENSFFFSHVRDVLIQRIVLLNSVNIASEASVASVRQELYIVCVNKLCLLAKFLSLINFLPYQDKDVLPPHLRIPLVDARKHTLPPIDLDGLLTEAIETGKILITLPWIVELLIGIDDTSIQLPYYKVLLAKLQYLLYKIKLPSNNDPDDNHIFLVYTEDVKMLIMNVDHNSTEKSKEKISHRMNVPQLKKLSLETTSNLRKRFVDECLQTIECTRILITLYVNSLFNNLSVSTVIKMDDMMTLTNLPILVSSDFYIDSVALYQCFPQFNEFKLLLEGGKKLSYKSIIPKTEKTFCDHQANEAAAGLDMQLEMHFFDNMPNFVKYTVDVVAKQISSHCISIMRDKIIPELKTQLCDDMKVALMEKKNMDEVDDLMLGKFYDILRRAVNEELSILYKSIENSLMGMLRPDIREDARIFSTCVEVTCRKCIEITYNWIFSYISFDGIVKEVKKISSDEAARSKLNMSKVNEDKKTKKSKTDLIKHDFNTLMTPKSEVNSWDSSGPVQILHCLRHEMRLIIASSDVNIAHKDAYPVRSEGNVTVSNIEHALQDAINCIEQRADLQFIAFRRIMFMSLDLISVMVFLRPDLVTNAVLKKFSKIWAYRKECKLHLHFEQILSHRNVEMYSKRNKQEQEHVRLCLNAYLNFTFENKMMHSSRLFRQILKLLQYDWPDEEMLREILVCVTKALEKSCPNKKIIATIESLATLGETERD